MNLILLLCANFIPMSAYKFRVLLDNEGSAEIFRDIIIDQKATFETFYESIKAAFSFKHEQMASFYVSNEDWDKGEEISIVDVNFDLDAEPVGLMSNLTLEDRVIDSSQKFILVHDFLNMWIFLVELQSFVDEDVSAPYVSLAMGNAPDEESREELNEFEDAYDFNENDEFGDSDDLEDDFDEDEFGEGYEQRDEYDY